MLEENKSNKNVVILVIAVIVLVAIAYFLTKGYSSQRQNTVAPQEGPQITKENVVVKNTNLGAAGTAESKLPEGFPSGIPVETAGVMESYSAVYQDRGLTQYAVSFTTDKSVVAVFGEYDLYMKNAGYAFGPEGRDEARYFLYGTKNNDDMSVAISSREGQTFVQIGFLDR